MFELKIMYTPIILTHQTDLELVSNPFEIALGYIIPTCCCILKKLKLSEFPRWKLIYTNLGNKDSLPLREYMGVRYGE